MSSRPKKRVYASARRKEAAAVTREGVLRAARSLFARRGIDAVTIAEVAEKAGVSGSTIYALFKSKEGVLRALMEGALFGPRYQMAMARLDALEDPVEQIAATASVSRAIYENETAEFGLIRGVSAFSPALRDLEKTFEATRFALQEKRIERLYSARKAKKGLPIERARRLMWMYTCREIYRLLVHEGSWAPEEYEKWLEEALLHALVGRGT
jgi:AcrR family transcriptional regulator